MDSAGQPFEVGSAIDHTLGVALLHQLGAIASLVTVAGIGEGSKP